MNNHIKDLLELVKDLSKERVMSISNDPPDGDNHNSNLPYYNDIGEVIYPIPELKSMPTGFSPYVPYTPPTGGTYQITLPPGHSSLKSWNPKMYGQQNTDYDWLQGMNPTPQLPEIKCDCGTTKTLENRGDHWQAHSDWCECYKQQRLK